MNLIEVVEPALRYDLQVYVIGLRQLAAEEKPIYYRTYDDENISVAKTNIERCAYGDFDEAMADLEKDLMYYDRSRGEDPFLTDIYRSEYFGSDEDRAIWNELREVLNKWGRVGTYDSAADNAVHDAVERLRDYQQKSYGALVPTMTGTYIKKSSEGSHGVGVRLAWVDECLRVTTRAPFYEELDDFFIYQSPVESRKMFTPECFPKNIGGYVLMGVSSNNLFEYEL